MAYLKLGLTVRSYDVRMHAPITQRMAEPTIGKVVLHAKDKNREQHPALPSPGWDKPGAGKRAQLEHRLKVLGVLP